jgi:hypothetical protein
MLSARYIDGVKMPRKKKRDQKAISVEAEEWALLDRLKRDYEQRTAEEVDWGNFLETVALLGLAAAGVYGRAECLDRTESAASARCSACGLVFPVAVPHRSPRAIHFRCPACRMMLVLHLRPPEAALEAR